MQLPVTKALAPSPAAPGTDEPVDRLLNSFVGGTR
jgi:hypothetical protein